MRISDWSSDVCSSDLLRRRRRAVGRAGRVRPAAAARSRMTTHGAAPHPPRFDCLPGEAKNTMNAPDTRKSLHHLRPRCSPLAVAIVAGLLAPAPAFAQDAPPAKRSEEHTSELQSIMRIPY